MKLMFVQVQAVKSAPKVQKYTYHKVNASSQEVGASSQEIDASSQGVLQHKYPRREGKTGSKSSNCSSEEVDSAEKPKLRKTQKSSTSNAEVNLI